MTQESEKPLLASCGCGEVSLRLGKEIYSVFNCHCQDCRSHNGVAFTSYVVSSCEGFEIEKGAAYVKSYQVDQSNKYFCSQCATPLFNSIESYPNIRLVYLGSLPESADLKPSMNVWCDTQLPWVNHIGELKSFARGSE